MFWLLIFEKGIETENNKSEGGVLSDINKLGPRK
jgi:hypothetical protein